MTLRLILIRHAKSGWDDPFADDHARKLTDRGTKAASAIGGWLQKKGFVPDQVLSSDAVRAGETARHLSAALTDSPNINFVPSLYHASPDTIIDLVRSMNGTIAVVGHNPGLGMAAHALVRDRPQHGRFCDYPTCATTIIDFDGPPGLGSGTCIDFIVPRDLTD